MRSVAPSGSEGVLFRFSFASRQSLVWKLSFLYLHFQRPLVLVLLFPFRADVQQHWHWLFPIPFFRTQKPCGTGLTSLLFFGVQMSELR